MKKALRWILRGLLGLGSLLALFHLVENWRGQRAWDHWKAAQEAKCVRYDWSKLTPPEVPDAENFAKAPVVEAAVLGKGPILKGITFPEPYPASRSWRLGQREDLDAWRRGYQTQDLEKFLSIWNPALDELSTASQRPYLRLPGKSACPGMGEMGLPLLGFRAAVRVLRLRALTRLEAGQSGAALEDVLTILRIARHLRNEPALIVQLLEIAITNLSLQPIWEGVTSHAWNQAQLSRLQAELEGIDLIRSFRQCIENERIYSHHSFEGLLQGSALDLARSITSGFEPDNHPPSRTVMIGTWLFLPKGWIRQNMVNMDRFFTEGWLPLLNPSAHCVDLKAYRRLAETFEATRRPTPYSWLSQMSIPALVGQTKRVAFSQNGVDEAVVACALERHRLIRGTYPASLSALRPAYLATIPNDVVEGGPLRYDLNGDGTFKLYSVGWNGTDEGGEIHVLRDDSQHLDVDRGDWSWPQPKK